MITACTAAPIISAADKPTSSNKPAAKSGQEPLIGSVTPILMRTEASRAFCGSKKTILTPARETETGVSDFSKEEFAALGITWEEFLTRATAAAARLLPTLREEIHRDDKKTALYATLKSDRQFTPMVMLTAEFRKKYASIFGEKLIVLTPDQYTLYVFPRNFSDFQKLGQRIVTDHEEALYPASIEAFEVTADGVRCIGAFDDGTR